MSLCLCVSLVCASPSFIPCSRSSVLFLPPEQGSYVYYDYNIVHDDNQTGWCYRCVPYTRAHTLSSHAIREPMYHLGLSLFPLSSPSSLRASNPALVSARSSLSQAQGELHVPVRCPGGRAHAGVREQEHTHTLASARSLARALALSGVRLSLSAGFRRHLTVACLSSFFMNAAVRLHHHIVSPSIVVFAGKQVPGPAAVAAAPARALPLCLSRARPRCARQALGRRQRQRQREAKRYVARSLVQLFSPLTPLLPPTSYTMTALPGPGFGRLGAPILRLPLSPE